MAVLQQMVIFLLLIMAGIIAKKCGFITKENEPQLTKIVVSIAYPALILSGVTGSGEHIRGHELLEAMAVIGGLLALLFIAAWLMPRILRYGRECYGIVNVMVICTNIGFMGVPMIDGIYGKDALIYITLLLIPFNLLFYSYVIQAIRGGGENPHRFKLSDLINPGMISCVAAVLIYFLDLPIPYIARATVVMLGNLTAPLAMMLMGAFLLETDWSGILKDWRVWAFTFLKMIAVPACIVLLIEQFTDNIYLLAVCMATAATPSGNVIPLLASLYNKKAYPVSVQGVALTTLSAVFTMPIVSLLTGIG